MSLRVLLVLRDYRRAIHAAVAAYARAAGWQLEFAGARLRPGWYGDGLIADELSEAELATLKDTERLWVVVRNHLHGPRIRQVHGDAPAIARMAFAHFRKRGYRHFATADALPWAEDPAAEFARVVEEEGFAAHYLCWGQQVPWEDYGQAVEQLTRFLGQVPKPCGVLIPGLWAIGHFYRACSLAGIHIPQELALLVNNDDPLICDNVQPTVSSIAGQISQFGWAMAKRLDDLMAGRDGGTAPLLIGPDRIITRQSTDMLAVPHGPTARAVRHLVAHYGEPLTVAELAREAGMSVLSLEHQFRRHFGKLPRQMLCEMRMERARELLAATDLPLHRIATLTGYGSAMAFHTAFSRTQGSAPGIYRAREQARRVEEGPDDRCG